MEGIDTESEIHTRHLKWVKRFLLKKKKNCSVFMCTFYKILLVKKALKG